MKYPTAEFEKLEELLQKAGIRFYTQDVPSFGEIENKKILLYFGGIGKRVGIGFEALSAPGRKCSVINYGYGSDNGLLEMSCVRSMMTEAEVESGDSCIGSLSAEDIFLRIKSDWEKSEVKIVDNTLVSLRTNGNVVIPNGITEIGDYALKGYIKSIVVPYGVTKIGEYAFAGQWDLKYAKLPSTVREIAPNAFDGVDDQYFIIRAPEDSYAVEWGKKNNYWYEDCCECHLEDGKVVFDHVIDEIPDVLFSEEEAALVKEIIIPEGVTYIYYQAFKGCKNIESVTLPSTIKEIENWFRESKKIKNIKLAYGIEVIDDFAFHNCSIERVEIPDSVKYIGEFAFAFCPISELLIGQGVEEIGMYAFDGINMTEVVVPESVKTIGYGAFSNAMCEEIPIIRENSIKEE